MSLPVFQLASGVANGGNKTFYTTSNGVTIVPYTAGTLAVYLNGQLLYDRSGNPWAETDPATGRFDFDDAPLTSDDVAVFFLDTSAPVVDAVDCIHIFGSLEPLGELDGTLEGRADIFGSLEERFQLSGNLDVFELFGDLDVVDNLSGVLSCPVD